MKLKRQCLVYQLLEQKENGFSLSKKISNRSRTRKEFNKSLSLFIPKIISNRTSPSGSPEVSSSEDDKDGSSFDDQTTIEKKKKWPWIQIWEIDKTIYKSLVDALDNDKKDNNWRDKATHIYRKYIDDDSPFLINVSYRHYLCKIMRHESS